METQVKPLINVAFIGNQGCGKSTTAGHFAYICGGISKSAVEKAAKDAENFCRITHNYAFLFDNLVDERKRGISVYWSVKKINTSEREIVIINTPGDKRYLGNMYAGTSMADAAVIMVSAKTDEFNGGISKYGKTLDQAIIAFSLGIRQIIVCVNKMDHMEVKYSQELFQEIKTKITEILKKIGFKTENIPFIPISGYQGENMIKKSDYMTWYDGPTLLDAINSIIPPKRFSDKPLRISIHGCYRVTGIGSVYYGRVESGILKKGMKIQFGMYGIQSKAPSIQTFGKEIDEAFPGTIIGFHTVGLSTKDIRRGDICGNPEDELPLKAEDFIAQIFVVKNGEIKKGYKPVCYTQGFHETVEITDIIAKIDMITGTILEDKPNSIKFKECGLVKISARGRIQVEEYSQYPAFGRIAFKDNQRIVAVGIVKTVNREQIPTKK